MKIDQFKIHTTCCNGIDFFLFLVRSCKDYLKTVLFFLSLEFIFFFSLRKHIHGNSTILVKNFQPWHAGLEILLSEVGPFFNYVSTLTSGWQIEKSVLCI